MFDSKSRYYRLKDLVYTTPDGQDIIYKERRFLPQGHTLPLMTEVTTRAHDRLDLITARTLGDSEQFWQIADANDAMNPFDLVNPDEPGDTLIISTPQAG